MEYRVVVLVDSPVRMPGLQGVDGLRQRIVLDDDLDDVQDRVGVDGVPVLVRERLGIVRDQLMFGGREQVRHRGGAFS